MDCKIEKCFNSGVWVKGGAVCHLQGGKVENCGGYGALYCTNWATLKAKRVKQFGNPRGCGVFVLHDKSRVVLDSCQFDSNKWSGFGCRFYINRGFCNFILIPSYLGGVEVDP